MNHEHDPRERFDIQIKTDNMNIDLEGLTRISALNYVNGLLKENPFDEYLQENLPVVISGFGFVSVGGDGKSISIKGYLPHTDTGEKHTCGRRITDFGPWERTENIDTWMMVGADKKCSFCGSMHPDRVLELIT